jgi:hypothetical protein
MSIRLNPTTSYRFSHDDLDFVLELAKVGSVRLCSSQVTLLSDRDKGFQFKQYADADKCIGLTMPSNWIIEGIYCSEKHISITFGVDTPTEKVDARFTSCNTQRDVTE